MEMSTSTTKKSMKYGFLMIPSTHCKVINVPSREELLLSPGIQYYIPWNRENIEVVRVENVATGSVYSVSPMSAMDEESFNWLKIAERSLRFWDNKIDDIWNNV
mgnify:CR=1 FL=1